MRLRFLLPTCLLFSTLFLQAGCNPFSIPKTDPPEVKGVLIKLQMPSGGYRDIYYKKDNPNILFLSEKGAWGPGIFIDLKTGKEERVESRRRPEPLPRLSGESMEDYYNRVPSEQRPGESVEDWLKRAPSPKPIADRETFQIAGLLNNGSDPSKGYSLRYKGDYTTEYGLATKGDVLPTGVRTVTNLRFTGDLEITIRGIIVVRQYLENVYQEDFRYRAEEAEEVGLLFYRDAMRNQAGTLYILRVPRLGSSSPAPEPEGQGVVGHPGPKPVTKKSISSTSKEPK